MKYKTTRKTLTKIITATHREWERARFSESDHSQRLKFTIETKWDGNSETPYYNSPVCPIYLTEWKSTWNGTTFLFSLDFSCVVLFLFNFSPWRKKPIYICITIAKVPNEVCLFFIQWTFDFFNSFNLEMWIVFSSSTMDI